MQKVLIELTETAIYKYLEEIDKQFAENIQKFAQVVIPILDTINDFFPYYTRHDACHSLKVLNRMSSIIIPDCLKKGEASAFLKEEALLLIAAAFAHDIGMAVFPDEEDELLKELEIEKAENWKTNPTLQAYLRKNHSNRGGAYIAKHHNSLGIPQNCIDILDELMRAHNDSIATLDKKRLERYSAGEKEIDLPQLACILCIADAIEFSDIRVLDGVIEELNNRLSECDNDALRISLRENYINKGIGSGVAVSEHDGKILFTGHYDDPEILNFAHKALDEIERWIRNYCDIDFRSKQKRLKLRSDSLVRNLKAKNYEFERLGIRMKHDNVISLITSNSAWTNDQAIAIRELLQNAVESCRYRRYNTSQASNYSPAITIVANSKENTISVRDNGCGMSKSTILNNFLTVGNSRSIDPSYSSQNYSTLARFGIGFWSCFTIASHVQISTAPFEIIGISQQADQLIEGVKFEVALDKRKDYTIFERITRSAGTTIKLFLKPEISLELAISKMSWHIACSEIPISVDYDGTLSYIPTSPEPLSLIQALGPKSVYALQLGIKEHTYEFDDDTLEIRFRYFYRINNGKLTFLLPDGQGLWRLNQARSVHHRELSICGFLVNFAATESLIKATNVGYLSINIKQPKGFEFTLNRMGLLRSEKTDQLVLTINIHTNNAVRGLFEKLNITSPKEKHRLWVELRKNVQSHHGIPSVTLLRQVIEDGKDLLYMNLIRLMPNIMYANRNNEIINVSEIPGSDLIFWSIPENVYFDTWLVEFSKQPQLAYSVLSNLVSQQETNFWANNKDDLSIVTLLATGKSVFNVPISNGAGAVYKIPVTKYWFNNTRSLAFSISPLIQTQDWTGYIHYVTLSGATWVFDGRQLLYVKIGSFLEEELNNLLSKRNYSSVAKLIRLLWDADSGFWDASIQKYINDK